MSLPQRGRIISLDLVRLMAAIGVVAIHADVITASMSNYVGGISWWLTTLVHALSRTSVPLFIMVSGSLLLSQNKKTNFKSMLLGGFKRLAIPFIFWSLVYFWWNNFWKGYDYSGVKIAELVWQGSVFHLYFLPLLFGLYVTTPLVKKYLPNDLKQKYASVGMFVLASGIITALYVVWKKHSWGNILVMFLPYLSYYLAGNQIANWHYSLKLWIVQLGSILLLTVILAGLSYQNVQWYQQGILTFWSDGGGQYFMEHFSPLVILLSLLTFSVIYHANQFFPELKWKWLTRSITAAASLTYGVYLIHPLILDLLDHYAEMAVHLVTGNLFWYYLKKIAITWVISAAAAGVMKKVPGLRVVLGEKPAPSNSRVD